MKMIRLIVGCLLFASGSSYGMYKGLSLEELKKKLDFKERSLKGFQAAKNTEAVNSISKEIEEINNQISAIEQQAKLPAENKRGFKETAYKLKENAQARMEKSKKQSVIRQAKEKGEKLITSGATLINSNIKKLQIKNIKSIEKLLATDNELFLLYKAKVNDQVQVCLEQLDSEDPEKHLPIHIHLEETISGNPVFCDLATDKNYYAYGYFFWPTKGKSQSDIIKKDTSSEEQEKVSKVHETQIKTLFFDDQFMVSHSQHGNIRFFSMADFKSTEKQIDQKVEYKAERLLAYKNKCLVVEEHSLILGTELLIKYLDDNANIIRERRLGSYKKNMRKDKDGKDVKIDYCPYLVAINDNGDAIIYDKNKRVITHSFKGNDNSISAYSYDYLSSLKGLGDRVAQQIHYINNELLLVCDDRIYKITMPNRMPQEDTSLKPQLLFQLNQPLITPETNKPYSTTIVATTVQNNKQLWIVNKSEINHYIRSITI